MKFIIATLLLTFFAAFAFAQNEQSPVAEKNFAYKDWTYRNVRGGGETNLRNFAKGRKLVMVVYWAPWCPNWKHDVAFVQGLHEKYKDQGLAVIGVGEYDSVGKMKDHIDQYKLTFPNVYESDKTAARLTTVHYAQRTEAGDTRKWGSPWYVLLDPAKLEAGGENLTQRTTVVNGELIKQDAEKFIRERLGIASGVSKASILRPVEEAACDPDKSSSALAKP